MEDDQGRSKGIGFIEFASRDIALKAVAGSNGQDFGGRNLRLNMSDDRPQQIRAAPVNPDAEGSDTLFVGNVSFTSTQDDLRAFFEQVGEVRDVRLAMG